MSLFKLAAAHPKTVLIAVLVAAMFGVRAWQNLAVDVFPDVSVPRVTIQTEAGGLTAEEVEQLVSVPIEAVMNGIPGVSSVRSSSSGGLSFVWVDFDWDVDPARARFDVFERLARVSSTLPEEAHAEISPVVSVTGEIAILALTTKADGMTLEELREFAEYDLRTRLLAIPGIGEVAVMGGQLPEYRVAVDPRRAAEAGFSLLDVIEAARDSRTYLSAGYLADVAGEEVPLRQIARADSLEALRASPIPLANGAALPLSAVADILVAGTPRRGSSSYNGQEAITLSIQKTPGGNTLALTQELERAVAEFAPILAQQGAQIHLDAYRQADFINASVQGGSEVLRDAVIIVILVLLVTLLEVRTILVVLCTMPLSILLGVTVFPLLGLGVNVMTLGGLAVAAGDIVDAAIIFTEVVRRKLGENALLPVGEQLSAPMVIARAAATVAPGVLFSSFIVALVFLPLLMLSGLEGRFFRPLGLSYLCVFLASLVCAWVAVPALARLFRLGGQQKRNPLGQSTAGSSVSLSLGIRAMRAVYRPFLSFALKFPILILLLALMLAGGAGYLATGFGSSFLPPFHEDSFNVMLSLPPGASLIETERVSEACVPALSSIPGVLSVTRRTGRAERDQHAEPVSSSEFIVRVDLSQDTDAVRDAIRAHLGAIPGCAVIVGYPMAHRISAVLSGTEAELAINIFGDDPDVLRTTAARVKDVMATLPEVADVRANREIAVRTLRVDYDFEALREAGITPREAGEQVSVAFNGLVVGDVRQGIRHRAVTVRLSGDEDAFTEETVRDLILSGRAGKRVLLGDVAQVVPEIAPNLMLREGGRRKALISCNPAPQVSVGALVETLRERLTPLVNEAGCTISFGGSWQARQQAAQRLTVLSVGLGVLVFFILVFALGSARLAILSLINVPLGLVGAVFAVALADPVLSVSSLVGFVTVTGFVIRNGILLLNSYRDRVLAGAPLADALRKGSLERVAPIVMTSLTTVIGLIPIMLASDKPGGELLAPIAVVQFGGLTGAMILNLLVLPASVKLFGLGLERTSVKKAGVSVLALLLVGGVVGCRSYEPKHIDWVAEAQLATNTVTIATLDDAVQLALIGNRDINAKRLALAQSQAVAQDTGWWEDPEFDFDLKRILKSHPHPFLGGVGVKFTIPLSGVPGCEARAALFYAQAEEAEVRAAEQDLAVEVRQAAVGLAILRKRQNLLAAHHHDARILQAHKQIERLCEEGEVAVTERASVRRKRHECHHALMEVTQEIQLAEIAFLRLLGLRPETRLDFTYSADHFDIQIPSDLLLQPLDFVRHARVVAALARLDGSEESLKAEIRRQYPQLAIGPLWGNEEGNGRLGIGGGISLPLWNRNRKAIAEAEKTRDEVRFSAIDAWHELVIGYASAGVTFENLRQHPHEPPSEAAQVEQLVAAGELSPLDYLTIREEIFTAQLEELDWWREVTSAYIELGRFAVQTSKEDEVIHED